MLLLLVLLCEYTQGSFDSITVVIRLEPLFFLGSKMQNSKKTSIDDGVFSETGKWNVAKQYSEQMLMIPLIKCQEYRHICFHGTSELIDEFVMSDEDKTKAKIKAIAYYIKELESIIIDTYGQVKIESKKKLSFSETQLKLLYSSLSFIKTTKTLQNMNKNTNKYFVKNWQCL